MDQNLRSCTSSIPLLVTINKLLAHLWLDIWLFFLGEIEFISTGWFPGTDPAFKHSPHISTGLSVGLWKGYLRSLMLSCCIHSIPVLICLGSLSCKKPKFQLSSCWGESEEYGGSPPPLFHPPFAMYQHYCPRAWFYHHCATQLVQWSEVWLHPAFSPKRYSAHPCRHLHISITLKGVNFEARVSLLARNLWVQCQCKMAPQWTKNSENWKIIATNNQIENNLLA